MFKRKEKLLSWVFSILLCINSVGMPVYAEEDNAEGDEVEMTEVTDPVPEETLTEEFETDEILPEETESAQLSEETEKSSENEDSGSQNIIIEENDPEEPDLSSEPEEVLESGEEPSTPSGEIVAENYNDWVIYDDGTMYFYKNSSDISADYLDHDGASFHPWDGYYIDKIYLESGITEIGPRAFADEELSELYIPSTVSYMGYASLGGSIYTTTHIYYQGTESEWNSLQEFSPDSLNLENYEVHYESYDGILHGQGQNSEYSYSLNDDNTITITEYTGSDTVVEVPSSIDGKTVKVIGDKAFANCAGITSVTIPEGITRLNSGAFVKCDHLSSIYFPLSMEYIGPAAFQECTALEHVYYPGTLGQWSGITIETENESLLNAEIHTAGTQEGRFVFEDNYYIWSDGKAELLFAAEVQNAGKHFAEITINGKTATTEFEFAEDGLQLFVIEDLNSEPFDFAVTEGEYPVTIRVYDNNGFESISRSALRYGRYPVVMDDYMTSEVYTRPSFVIPDAEYPGDEEDVQIILIDENGDTVELNSGVSEFSSADCERIYPKLYSEGFTPYTDHDHAALYASYNGGIPAGIYDVKIILKGTSEYLLENKVISRSAEETGIYIADIIISGLRTNGINEAYGDYIKVSVRTINGKSEHLIPVLMCEGTAITEVEPADIIRSNSTINYDGSQTTTFVLKRKDAYKEIGKTYSGTIELLNPDNVLYTDGRNDKAFSLKNGKEGEGVYYVEYALFNYKKDRFEIKMRANAVPGTEMDFVIYKWEDDEEIECASGTGTINGDHMIYMNFTDTNGTPFIPDNTAIYHITGAISDSDNDVLPPFIVPDVVRYNFSSDYLQYYGRWMKMAPVTSLFDYISTNDTSFDPTDLTVEITEDNTGKVYSAVAEWNRMLETSGVHFMASIQPSEPLPEGNYTIKLKDSEGNTTLERSLFVKEDNGTFYQEGQYLFKYDDFYMVSLYSATLAELSESELRELFESGEYELHFYDEDLNEIKGWNITEYIPSENSSEDVIRIRVNGLDQNLNTIYTRITKKGTNGWHPTADMDFYEWSGGDKTYGNAGIITSGTSGFYMNLQNDGSIDHYFYGVFINGNDGYPIEISIYRYSGYVPEKTITLNNTEDLNYLNTYYFTEEDLQELSTDELYIIRMYAAGTGTASETRGYLGTKPIPANKPLTGITLSDPSITLKEGAAYQLIVEYSPADTTDDKTVQWVSSDESVVTVDQNGMITAINAGKATITATVGEYTAECSVVVIPNIPDEHIYGTGQSDSSVLVIDSEEINNVNFSEGPFVFLANETYEGSFGHQDILNLTLLDHPGYEPVAAYQIWAISDLGRQASPYSITKAPANVTEEEADDIIIVNSSNGNPGADRKTAVHDGYVGFTSGQGFYYVLRKKHITGISLDRTSLEMFVPGNSETLSAVITPEDTLDDKKVTWTSSDENVVTVDQNGTVTAVSEGTAVITAEAGGFTAECSVSVTEITDLTPEITIGNLGYILVSDTVDFTGSVQADTDKVKEWSWDFGDGETGTGMNVSHVYGTFGEYTVKLTVKDTYDNTFESSTVITIIDVNDENSEYTQLSFNILESADASPVNNALLVITDLEGKEIGKLSTNAEGTAKIVVANGSYRISTAAPSHMVRTITVNAAGGVLARTITLNAIDFITGEFTVTEMTYDEIIDAGIDVSAPGNQHVYKFETVIIFKDDLKQYEIPYIAYKNENDEDVGNREPIHYDPSPWPDDDDDDDGWGWNVSPGPDPEPSPSITVYPYNDKYALVVFGESHWLKEMFQVALVVMNNTVTETLENTVAELELPDGMSLAEMTGDAQALRQELGTVGPNENVNAVWYVRGDAEGDYNLNAHVTAVDMPYEETVKADFETTEPIHVYAGSALHLTITCDDVAERGKDYTVKYRLENVSSKPIYNISFGLKNSDQYTIKRYSDGNNEWKEVKNTGAEYDSRFTRRLKEMAPGGYIELELSTTIWFFSAIELNKFTVFGPFIDAAFYVEDAYVLEMEGSTTTIPYDIVINETQKDYLVDWLFDEVSEELLGDQFQKWNLGKSIIKLVGSDVGIPMLLIKAAHTALKLQQGMTDHVLTVTIDDGRGTDSSIENDVVRITTGDAMNSAISILNGTSYKMTAREFKFEAKGPGNTRIKFGVEDSYGTMQREYFLDIVVEDREIKDTITLERDKITGSFAVDENQMKLSAEKIKEDLIIELKKNPMMWIDSAVRFELEKTTSDSNDDFKIDIFNDNKSGGGVLWTKTHNNVEIDNESFNLNFPVKNVWESIAAKSGDMFSVSGRKLSEDEAKTFAEDAQVYEFMVQSDNSVISDLGGDVFVTVPYELEQGQNANDLYVEHFKSDGTSEILDAVYDSENKTVSFTTNSFSYFAVGVREKEGITLNTDSVILAPEETEQLYVVEGTEVTWKSSDENVVTVDETGKLTAVGLGTASVTATTTDGRYSAECKVIVAVFAESMKLSVNEEEILHAGETLDVDVTFTPEGASEKLTWTSSDESVATVDENGVVTALKSGETVISAANEDSSLKESFTLIVAVDVTGITLDQTEVTLTITGEEKESVQLIETLSPENATIKDVRWTSSDENVVTVNEETGYITAVNGGTAVITATTVDGEYTAECTVTVVVAVTGVTIYEVNEAGEEENVTAADLYVGEERKFNAKVLPENATNRKIVWESSDPEIAIVDEEGNVRALQAGDTVISATAEDGDSFAEVKLNIYEVEAESIETEEEHLIVPIGTEKKIRYKVLPESTTNKTVVFESEDEEIVSVSEEGVLKGLTRGTVTVTLSTEDGKISKEITVEAVPDGIYMSEIEKTYEYTGTAVRPEVKVYDRGIELTSSDYTVAYANNTNAGTATITIKMKGNYSGTVTENFEITPIDLGEDERITSDALTIQATGKTLSPVPSVYFNGTKLKKGTDFDIDYGEWETRYQRKEAGEWDLVLKGKGNYTGEYDFTVNVAERSADIIPVTKLRITSKTAKYQDLTGEDFVKDILESGIVTIKYGTKVLVYEDDYEINEIPEEYRQTGTLKFTITGVGDYYGDRTITVKITGISINDKKVKIVDTEPYVYTGEEQELHEGFHLTYNGVKMEPEDYEILEETYTKNLKVGTASVKIEGRNGFTGTRTVKYKITANKESITEKDVYVDEEVSYAKGGAKAAVEVYDDELGLTLVEGTDYTLKYTNNKKVGENTAKVTVTFKGNFKGTPKVEKLYSITPKDISETTLSAKDIVYTGKAGKYKSTPVLTDTDGKTLKAGTDYEKTYVYELDNEDGTYTVLDAKSIVEADRVIRVTVTGKGNYTNDTISTEYRILKKGYDIGKAVFTIDNQEYTGEEIEVDGEAFTKAVINKTEELVYGRDYEIVEGSYKNNVKKGTASVVLRGLYPYGGTKTVKFRIVQKPVEEYWQTLSGNGD